jgi:hypothetical protein
LRVEAEEGSNGDLEVLEAAETNKVVGSAGGELGLHRAIESLGGDDTHKTGGGREGLSDTKSHAGGGR